jgi:hypothetical protein
MSESNRISRLLAAARCADIEAAIKKARAISRPCVGPECSNTSENILDYTPYESDLLAFNVATKLTEVRGRTVGPASSRIEGIIMTTYGNSIDPFNPRTRFAQYAPRVVPPVCPPVPLIDRNANLPKASTKCPLPNKPYFPSIV